MSEIAVRLDEWRRAERRRGALLPDTPGWHAADVEVRRAQLAYRGLASQAAAYYVELDFIARERLFAMWPVRFDRQAAASR